MDKVDVLIVGGGLAGLSAALHVEGDYLLAEARERVGGLAVTEVFDGCVFDVTGHWLHLRNDRTKGLVKELVGERLKPYTRRAYILSHGRLVNYPFQANLADLGPQLAYELAISAFRAVCRKLEEPDRPVRTFRDFSLRHFGEGITREFIEPYNSKLWGVPIDEVTSSWCDRFVPVPDPEDIIKGAISPLGQGMGYNVRFLYPAPQGIEVIARALYERLDQGRILLNTPVVSVDENAHEAIVGTRRVTYERLINTAPLKDFALMLRGLPEGLREDAKRLRASRLVYAIGTVQGEELVGDAQWIYVPDRDIPIYRFGIPSNVDRTLARKGVSSFYAEFVPTEEVDEARAVQAVTALLERLGEPRRVEAIAVRGEKYGYVIFDEYRDQGVQRLRDYLEAHGIVTIGRFGAWTYNAMEDALLDGIEAAERITDE